MVHQLVQAGACALLLVSMLTVQSGALPTPQPSPSPTTDGWRSSRSGHTWELRPETHGIVFRHDYVAPGYDWENVLDMLRRQAESATEVDLSGELVSTEDDSIVHDRANYLNSDEELEEFIRKTAEDHHQGTSQVSERVNDESQPEQEGAPETAEDTSKLIECPICLSDINPKKSIYDPLDLKCGHSFHYVCLKNWSIASNRQSEIKNCPICRKEYTNMSLMDHVRERDEQQHHGVPTLPSANIDMTTNQQVPLAAGEVSKASPELSDSSTPLEANL